MHVAEARRGTRRQPEASRRAILQAALVAFAQEGIAGARMDAIAAAAGVNKALLYYYFRNKEALYGAVLDDFFVRLLGRVTQALDGEARLASACSLTPVPTLIALPNPCIMPGSFRES